MSDFAAGCLTVFLVGVLPFTVLFGMWALIDGPRAVWQRFFPTRIVHSGTGTRLTVREASHSPFLEYKVRDPRTGAETELFLMEKKWYVRPCWDSFSDFDSAIRTAADQTIELSKQHSANATQKAAARNLIARWRRER